MPLKKKRKSGFTWKDLLRPDQDSGEKDIERVDRDEVMRSGITRHHGVMPGDALKYIVYLSQSTNRISRT